MKVLFVASECAPVAKVGGLADVVGSLPKALKKLGVNVLVLIPFYGIINLKKEGLKLVLKEAKIPFNGREEKFNLWQTYLPESNVPLFLIENENYFQGNIYIEADASAGGSEEEAKRFLFLSAVAIKIGKILKFDILHCQDWHTAIAALLLKIKNVPRTETKFLVRGQKSPKESLWLPTGQAKIKNIKTLLTIHNLSYQGIYSAQIVNQILGTNFSGSVNCLREGILNANLINTVSPNYAKEILTPEYSYGLEKELHQRKENLVGILNGLDKNQFNPESDPYLKVNYSIETLDKKLENKIFLQKSCFKEINSEIPILGIVSRLAEQKGIDLIEEILPQLMKEGLQFILLGKGQLKYENLVKEKTDEFKGKFFAKVEFNEELAHQIYGGADIFLMPSLFEPCGLGQLIAMRYGTVPIARATGGLKDTIKNSKFKNQNSKLIEGTGFLFEKYDSQEFLKAIKEALEIFKNKKIWREIQENGMKQDFSWESSAKEYLGVYKKLFSSF